MSIDFAGKHVVVTGGSGCIGRPLVDLLIERGAFVIVASLDEVEAWHPAAKMKMEYGDLNDEYFAISLFETADYVFHLAGTKGGVGIGRSHGADFLLANNRVNENVIEAAAKAGALGFLFVSSIGVYPGDKAIFRESEAWEGEPHPSDYYGGWSKRFGEMLCQAFAEQYNFEYVVVRPTNTFGPFDNFDPNTTMVVGALIARIVAGEDPLKIWGDGQQERDLLYSEDCARGMLLAMEKGKSGEAYNLGSGRTTSIAALAYIIAQAVNKMPHFVFDPTGPVGNQVRLMSIEKSLADLGYRPSVSLVDGITKTVEWYKANPHYKTYTAFKSVW